MTVARIEVMALNLSLRIKSPKPWYSLMDRGNHKPAVVLAEDHLGILNKVTQLLAHDAKIVATVCDGSAAVRAVIELQPDVLVLDIAMPNLTGIEAAREIRRRGLSSRIIFLTIHQDPEMIDAACEIGASYVLKKKMHTDLILALREELVGRRFVSSPDGFPARTKWNSV